MKKICYGGNEQKALSDSLVGKGDKSSYFFINLIVILNQRDYSTFVGSYLTSNNN